jgi:hypothetical protein
VKRKTGFFLAFLLLFAQAKAQDALRGEVKIELEPLYGAVVDERYPLDNQAAYRRALEAAALFFSAQIYGWSFHYEVGERARGIEENFALNPLGEIRRGDPRLSVTHARFEDYVLSAWMDYRPSDSQARRLDMWKKGSIRTAQSVGYLPLPGPGETADWLTIRKDALEESARAAVRAMLQGSERNRPKEAAGFISLQYFPSYWMDAGRWAAHARFRVNITEIIPFSVY